MWDSSCYKKNDLQSTCYNPISAVLMIFVETQSDALEYKINAIVNTSERS